MPYRRKGTVVQVKRGNGWVTLKKHPTIAKAIAHLKALQANVTHGRK